MFIFQTLAAKEDAQATANLRQNLLSLEVKMPFSSLFKTGADPAAMPKRFSAFYEELKSLESAMNSSVISLLKGTHPFQFTILPGLPPLIFELDWQKREITRITADEPFFLIAGLKAISDAGLLGVSMGGLGFSKEDIEEAVAKTADYAAKKPIRDAESVSWAMSKNRQGFKKESLPPIKSLDPDNCIYVNQHEAISIKTPKKGQFLYTSFAFDCAILMLVAGEKNEFSGKSRIAAIAQAHVDKYTSESAIRRFYEQFETSVGNGCEISAYIISGSKNNLANIIGAMPREAIKGVDSEFGTTDDNATDFINDCAAVRWDGKIHYGHSEALDSISRVVSIEETHHPWLNVIEYNGLQIKGENKK